MPITYNDQTDLNRKLDPEFKAEWLTALRSGDYKQGKKVLSKMQNGEQRFCCLGVACDILGKKLLTDEQQENMWVPSFVRDSGNLVFQGIGADGISMPSYAVEQHAYGNGPNGSWTIYLDEKDAKRFIKDEDLPYENYVHLPSLNDRGFPFKSIAYLIEKYL